MGGQCQGLDTATVTCNNTPPKERSPRSTLQNVPPEDTFFSRKCAFVVFSRVRTLPFRIRLVQQLAIAARQDLSGRVKRRQCRRKPTRARSRGLNLKIFVFVLNEKFVLVEIIPDSQV